MNVLGEICAGQTCLGGLVTAHGQITERNYSVTRLQFFYFRGSERLVAQRNENSLIFRA